MSRKYFGTDGVRGTVGDAPITPDFVMHLGYAAGKVLARKAGGGERPAVLIGKDTRVSGYMLESALEAGLSAAGVDVLLVGPMPTPGVAYLTRALRLSAGIVISASHNPHQDNGIKFFSATGSKLADATETAIEAVLDKPLHCMSSARLGKARRIEDAAGRYIEFCKSTFPANLDLRGLRIAVDCAHGAGYHIAPHVFHELGADVVTVGAAPDGFNINKGVGATHPESLRRAVRRAKADLGIALDGDGDRLVMADAAGRIYDGDELLYVIAAHRKRSRQLKGGVVGTQMTNLAMAQALAKLKIPFARARVGDRYVLEMLEARGWQLGGENSGHIICLDRHTTGDAIVSALQVLQALLSTRTTLAQAVNFALYPQVLVNVRVANGAARTVLGSAAVVNAVTVAERALGTSGRVLLRASGTEPVIRVMVEGKARTAVARHAAAIAKVVREAD
ncbi:MAG: phosphoglucosamine mutase [Betaproteobacteria bacterium]|nr:MAG: phosphoglucosamine mutase [Betaproteobacteria bacterium]